MRELRLLLWLRWRQTRGTIRYWLRAGVGYDPARRATSEYLYAFYLLLLGSVWLPATWLEILDVTARVGQALTPHGRMALLLTLPLFILLAQVGLLMAALRSSPLKLSYPDMAYIAAAPLPRTVPLLVAFLGQALKRLLLFVPAGALLSVALTGATRLQTANPASLRGALAAAPLVLLCGGIAWLAGALRLSWPRLRGRRFAWLYPLWLLVPAILIPPVMLWPGRALTLEIQGTAPPGAVPLLYVLAVACAALLVWAGDKINMIAVIDESRLYARIRALGGTIGVDPRVVQSIRRQESLAGRKPMLTLPRASGVWALVARAALTYARRTWLLVGLPRAASLLLAGSWILLGHTTARLGTLAALPWLAWLFLIVAWPPRGVVDVFQGDLDAPFMRQFLPADTLRLLLADAAPPLALVALGALLSQLLARTTLAALLPGSALFLALGIMLALCQGIDLVRVGVMQWRLPYRYAAATGFGAVMLTGALAHAFLPALAVAVVLDAGLARMLARGV